MFCFVVFIGVTHRCHPCHMMNIVYFDCFNLTHRLSMCAHTSVIAAAAASGYCCGDVLNYLFLFPHQLLPLEVVCSSNNFSLNKPY